MGALPTRDNNRSFELPRTNQWTERDQALSFERWRETESEIERELGVFDSEPAREMRCGCVKKRIGCAERDGLTEAE